MPDVGKTYSWPTEADYAWVDDWQEAFCLALVNVRTPEEVLSRLVPEPPTGIVSVEEARRWAEAQGPPHDGTSIEAGTLGGWTLAVEFLGYRATLQHVLRRLAEGTAAVVVYLLEEHTGIQAKIDFPDDWVEPEQA